MSAIENIQSRFLMLPRAYQWLAAAVVFVVGFLFWDGTIRQMGLSMSLEADKIEKKVVAAREGLELKQTLLGMRETVASCGPVQIPGDDAEGKNDIDRVFNELMNEFRTSESEWGSTSGAPLKKNVLTTITGGQGRIGTVRADLNFQAKPEDATAIIAAFESDPAVECIRSLRIDKMGGGKVKVTMEIEAWVLDTSGRRRGVGLMQRFPLTWPVVVSVVCVVCVLFVIAQQLPPVFSAAFGGGAGDEDPAAIVTKLLDEHEQDFQTYQDRFNGRSIFYPPPAPAPKRPPRPVRKPIERPPVEQTPDPTPATSTPVAPDVYQGPSVSFIVGDVVWFKPTKTEDMSLQIRKGEEKEGVRVIEIDAPWTVKVGHKGGEYDVNLFERGPNFIQEASDNETASIPGVVRVALNDDSIDGTAAAPENDETPAAENAGSENAEKPAIPDEGEVVAATNAANGTSESSLPAKVGVKEDASLDDAESGPPPPRHVRVRADRIQEQRRTRTETEESYRQAKTRSAKGDSK